MKKIQNLDVTALLRPARVAIIVNFDEVTTQYLSDILLPFVYSHWAGATHFIFPYRQSLDLQSDEFKRWLNILCKFDPDTIYSSTNTSSNFKKVVLDNVITTNFFEHNLSVARPCMGYRGSDGRTNLEDVIKSSKIEIDNIYDFTPTFDPLLDLWFFSNYGRLGKSVNSFSDWVELKPLSRSDVYTNATEISKRQFHYKNSPHLASFLHLGYSGAKDLFYEGVLPRIIVFGDTHEDWALFWSLRSLYDHVHWVPPSLLNLDQQYYDKMDYLLFDLLSSHSFNNSSYPPIITSRSLDQATITQEVNNVVTRVSNSFSPHAGTNFLIELDFPKLITNWLNWGEFNNKNEQCIFFSDNSESIQRAPSLAPKNFKPDPTKVKYYVELTSDQFRYLGHPYSKSPPVVWKNPKSAIKDDARKTITGDICFWGMNHLIRPGQDIDSLLRGPRIIALQIFEQFHEVLRTKSLTSSKTVGTQNIEVALSLWTTNLDLLALDMFNNDTSQIFKTFQTNYNKGAPLSNSHIHENSWIFFERQIYFTLLKSSHFTAPLTSLTDETLSRWLDNQILIRGERLTCQTCGKSSFYDETKALRKFSCKWCGKDNLKNYDTMAYLEPRFLYGLNPLLYSLFERNSHVVLKTLHELSKISKIYFDWTTEVQIIDHEGRDIMEVDFVANIDGELFIGECKSNGKIDSSQLKKYKWLCKRFKINNFVLGSEKGWSSQAKINILSMFSEIQNKNYFY